MHRDGTIRTVSVEEMGLSYRHNSLPADVIFLDAVFQGQAGDPETSLQKIEDIKQQREASQPIREKTGGSTFANPDGHKAWQLIDQAGGRGLRIGGASMSEQHCNFMINDGSATSQDLEDLGEEIRRRVKETSGVELRWEIRRIGETG